jgi:hypothetical protein
LSLSGALIGPTDPIGGTGVGDRDYNDARYSAAGAGDTLDDVTGRGATTTNSITVASVSIDDKLAHTGDANTYLNFAVDDVQLFGGGVSYSFNNFGASFAAGLSLSGALIGPTDPTGGTGVGDRDYNDARYVLSGGGAETLDSVTDRGSSTTNSITVASVSIASSLNHTGDANTYLNFATDNVQLVGGGVVYSFNSFGVSLGAGLSVTGGITATANVTAYSDLRLKKDIRVIDNALDKVLSIDGVTFDRTDIDIPRQTGVIAQEVLKMLPEAVVENEDGMLSVAYGNMVGLLIESIKEQQVQINELVEEVRELKK